MEEDDVNDLDYLPEDDSTQQQQERNVWDSHAVRSLINEYKKFRLIFGQPEVRKRKVWGKISERLQALGFDFDADQCEKKWRNLKNYYSMNKQKDMVTWPYYKLMKDAIGQETKLKGPVNFPNENGQKIKMETSEISNFTQEEDEDDDSAPPAWFTKFLTQFREDEKDKLDMLEKMHEDIIQLEKKKCSLLQTMIEKLT